MADVSRTYRIVYAVTDSATPSINKLAGAVNKLDAESKGLVQTLRSVDSGMGDVASGSAELNRAVAQLVDSLGDVNPLLVGMNSRLGRMDANGDQARASMAALAASLTTVGAQVSGINELQAALQRSQRTTYGLDMNARRAAQSLGDVAAAGAGINGVGTATQNLGNNLGTTTTAGHGLTASLNSISLTSAGIDLAKDAARALGESFNSAREWAKETAEESLKVRDALREIANLSGKAGADDATVDEHSKLRVATGMDSTEARKFQEQFRGSLPLAKDKGGIDDKTAGELASGVGRLSVRTGLDAGTAGDLAGVMGSFGKVPTAKIGLGRTQMIVDQLNDGRGNLTPLTKELMKGAAATVGQGQAFGSLQERAAAIATSTGLGSVGQASTRINQAIAGLGGFDQGQGAALQKAGITGKDDFLSRLEKIKPLIDAGAKRGLSADDSLREAGFKNQTERRSISGFVGNIDVLRKRTLAVREDPNDPDAKANAAGDRAEGLNAEFYGKDKAARNRVATAKLDDARLQRGRVGENLAIARKEAEADLTKEGSINTPGTNFIEAIQDGFGLLPSIGLPSARQKTIDDRVKKNAGQTPDFGEINSRGFLPFTIATSGEGGVRDAADQIAERDASKVKVRPPAIEFPQARPIEGAGGAGDSDDDDAGQNFAAREADPASGANGQGGGGADMLKQLVDLTKEANRQRAKTTDQPLPAQRDAFPAR